LGDSFGAKEPQNPSDGQFGRVKREYHEAIKRNSDGAIFFAVCRGKVSEGLDFTDENARGLSIYLMNSIHTFIKEFLSLVFHFHFSRIWQSY
jgi:hypothetical protein